MFVSSFVCSFVLSFVSSFASSFVCFFFILSFLCLFFHSYVCSLVRSFLRPFSYTYIPLVCFTDIEVPPSFLDTRDPPFLSCIYSPDKMIKFAVFFFPGSAS